MLSTAHTRVASFLITSVAFSRLKFSLAFCMRCDVALAFRIETVCVFCGAEFLCHFSSGAVFRASFQTSKFRLPCDFFCFGEPESFSREGVTLQSAFNNQPVRLSFVFSSLQVSF